VRARLLKTTVLAAVAGAMWTQMPQVSLRLRRLSLKCWFMGHDDWIRRTPDRLYLECFECGRETPGWLTKNHPVHPSSDPSAGAPVLCSANTGASDMTIALLTTSRTRLASRYNRR
jgi:hypothetical protein